MPIEPLVKSLYAAEIVAESLPYSYGRDSYLVGEQFFDAFLFLGCSPSIELTPNEQQQPFCYIQFEVTSKCKLVSGSNLKAACKACKQRYKVPLLLEEKEDVPVVICSYCKKRHVADRIAWRKSAALSKVSISLWNIFEGEAVPSDKLFSLLQEESGEGWSYAYVSG